MPKRWEKITGWVCVDRDGKPDFTTYSGCEQWAKDKVAEHSDYTETWEENREPFGWTVKEIQIVYVI